MNTRTYEKRFGRVLVTLGVALISLHYGVAIAQEPQPNKPQAGPGSRKISQLEPAQAQALKQLVDQIEGIEAGLRKLRERIGANDPKVVQAQKELTEIVELQKQIAELSQGELNENDRAEIAYMWRAVAGATGSAQMEYLTSKNPDQAAELQRLQQMKEQLAEQEKQMATMAKQMEEQRRRPALPPLENGQVKMYSLAYSPAREAAHTIESLFGSQALRVGVDERTNTLVVYAKPDSIAALDALLERLDRQAAPTNAADKSKQSAIAAPRSLLLRVFWLADGLPEGAGQKPADFLPKSVLLATNKLGLEAPQLVTQTVNSLALGREEAAGFSTNVPAVLLGQPVGLNCEGKLKLVSEDRVQLEMGVNVGGPSVNCQLKGSLATPLGHYMVLGTANSMIAEDGPAAGAMGAGPGMMPGGAPGGPEGGGRFGVVPQTPGAEGPRGFRGAGGLGRPGATPPGAEFGPGAGAPAAKPIYNTSRFAFVVQVIEGQSYPAEKGKSDGE